MLRCILLPTLILCALASWTMCVATSLAAEDADGFTAIFNGKDLTGWEGEPGWWSVQDGALTGQTTTEKPLKQGSYLFWRDGKPANFELRAVYRFQGSFGNSGINFRSQELSHGDVKGYQADMDTGGCTGSIYEVNQREGLTQRGQKVTIAEDGRRQVSQLTPAIDWSKLKASDWNEYTIIAQGPEIILRINGLLASHTIDCEKGKAAADGVITLQLHPGPPMKVQFKSIRIKILP